MAIVRWCHWQTHSFVGVVWDEALLSLGMIKNRKALGGITSQCMHVFQPWRFSNSILRTIVLDSAIVWLPRKRTALTVRLPGIVHFPHSGSAPEGWHSALPEGWHSGSARRLALGSAQGVALSSGT